jgi:hypothetical protein
MGTVNDRFLTEDYYFCHYAREAGVEVLVDTKQIFGHLGWIQYPLSDQILFEAINSRTPKDEDFEKYVNLLRNARKEKSE